MATLNVKNLPDDLYERVRARARRDRRSIAQEVTMLLAQAVGEPADHSVLELEGLGREVWAAGSAEQHVRTERDSWD